ncbi:MAG: hypothetical protein HQL89_11340, partial [Magnetococcales bacterium]|nr:hypothetical protein [Magnetococcales bacterium]
ATPEPAAATPEPAAATPEPAAATPEPTTPASEPETAPAPEPASDDTAASPLLEVTDVSGTEDTAIDLNLSAALTDTDGSESLTITLSGVPEGAELSSGIDNGNGTWTLEAGDLDHLTLTPPANSDADFTLSVMITSTESNGGASTSVTGSIHVDVAPDADPPMLVVHDASGTEDTPISLDILASLADTDGSESLSITLSGLPEGAELSAGTHNADGSWTLSADDLEGLHVTPPHDSDADFTLSVTATSTDGNDTSVVSGTINVSVAPDADPPTLTLQDAQGFEDQPIPLNIHFELHDIDGSETLAGNIVISNIPEGATLNLGEAGPDNTWIISQEDLAVTGTNAQGDPISWEIPGLTMTPPEHGDSDFSLGVAITIRDGDDVHTETGQFNIDLTAVADHADIDATRATGTEDTAIPLDIHFALQDQDGSESLSGNIVLTNIPEGAHLNVGEAGPGNTWVISQEDLHVVAHNDQGHPVAWEVPDLTITPPNNSDQDFNLGIRIVTMEGNEARVTNGEIDVIVNPDADEVVFSTSSKPTKVHPDSDEQKEGGSKGGGSKSGGSKDGGSKGGGSKDGGSKGGGSKDGGSKDGGSKDGGSKDGGSKDGGSKDGGSKDGGSKDGGSKGGGSKSGGSKDGGSKSGGSKSGGSKGGGSKSGEGTVGDDNGNEVELDISFALGDQDGSESLSGNIVLTDVPEGATFNIGQAGPDHSWELPLSSLAQTAFNDHGTPVAWNIPGLKISVPDGVDDNFDLGIRITTLDGNDTQVTEGHIGVDVYADNEAENPLEEPMDGKSIGGGSKDGGSKGGGSKDGGSKGGGSKDGGSKGGGSKDGGSKGGGSKDGGSKGGGSKGGESDSDGQVITVGHGDDVLELTVAHQGNGTDCRFEVYIDGQPIEGGPFSSDAVHSQGEWETIRFEGIDLGDGERVITIESVDDGGNQVLVDKIAINGEEIQAENGATWDNGDANVLGGDAVHVHQGEEIQFQVDINDEADQDPPQAQEEPEDQEEPQAQGNDDAPVADLNLAGGSGDDVLTGDAGNDTITGGAGDDVLGGESGNDTLMGGEGNDLFIFGTGDGVDYVDGGSGDGWLDAIHLENVSGGPGDNIENAGDWTLDSDSAFTMDGDGSIVFDDPNASGTVTLEDGSTIEFTNIDQIQW